MNSEIWISSAIRDIAERKKSEELFKALLEAAPDAMVIVNNEGKIHVINAQTENIFGYSRADLIGKRIEVLMPGRFRNNHTLFRTDFFKSPQVRNMGNGIELFAQKKDGTEFPVEISLSPLHTERGIWVSSAIRDITEKKAAQKEIVELNQRLEEKVALRTKELMESNKELEAFSYSVSHDLRSPLRAVNGYAKILEDDFHHALSDEGKRMLGLIKHNAIRMGNLIDDLIEFSRLGRKDLVKTKVNMAELAEEIVEEVKNTSRTNSKIRVYPIKSVACDKAMIKQVLINLMSNAVKFTSKVKDPVIEISSEESETEIIYSVKDNGTGFDMAYVEKLFNVFQRLHSTEEFDGTGIGLAIVKRVVLKHGGNVWAEGEIGHGATFFFSLPKS